MSTFSIIDTSFTESSQLIALPVILYLLKDNESIQTLCANQQLNMVLLLGSVFISKTNFQASVYLLITFIIVHLLGNCNSSSQVEVEEEFKPLENEDIQPAGDYNLSFNYNARGSESEIPPLASNSYTMTTENNVNQEPSNQPMEVFDPEGFSNDDSDNFQTF